MKPETTFLNKAEEEMRKYIREAVQLEHKDLENCEEALVYVVRREVFFALKQERKQIIRLLKEALERYEVELGNLDNSAVVIASKGLEGSIRALIKILKRK